MLAIAARFSSEMADAIALIDLLDAVTDLAKQNSARLRSAHPIARKGLEVHARARRLSVSFLDVDGVFLTICAKYELTIRSLVEEYARQLNQRKATFVSLPNAVKAAHSEGCAYLLTNLGRSQFSHLSEATIVANLHGCAQGTTPYSLVPDAFSFSERNMRSDMISEICGRIDLKKVWNKIAQDAQVQSHLGTSNVVTAEHRLTTSLNSAMERRNSIIHRGRTYYTAAPSEVVDTARLFEVVAGAMSRTLVRHLGNS